MNREYLRQQIIIAAAETNNLSFPNRLGRRKDQPLLMRLGKAAIGSVFGQFVRLPTITTKSGEDYTYLDHGYDNLVYVTPEQVLKVNVRTLTSDIASASQEAHKRQSCFEDCKKDLGDHWLDTSWSVRSFMDRFVVVSQQTRLQPEKSFSGAEELLGYRDDEAYVEQLESLFTCISKLHSRTAYYPDILGAGNIALINMNYQPRLIIVDTEPASPVDQERKVPNRDVFIGDAIRQKLDLWSKKLATPRALSESQEIVSH